MTGSWRKSQETKSPPWRKETYGLPAWQMLVLVISPLCTLFMWWVTTRHPLFFFFFSARTPLLHPHRRIFVWMNVWLLCKHWLAGQSGEKLLNLQDLSSVLQVSVPVGRSCCFQEKVCSVLCCVSWQTGQILISVDLISTSSHLCSWICGKCWLALVCPNRC